MVGNWKNEISIKGHNLHLKGMYEINISSYQTRNIGHVNYVLKFGDLIHWIVNRTLIGYMYMAFRSIGAGKINCWVGIKCGQLISQSSVVLLVKGWAEVNTWTTILLTIIDVYKLLSYITCFVVSHTRDVKVCETVVSLRARQHHGGIWLRVYHE